MTEIEPEYLLWIMIDGQDGQDLHCLMMAHVPDRDDLLAYQVLCGEKGKFIMKPWDGEPKCEACETKRASINVQSPDS